MAVEVIPSVGSLGEDPARLEGRGYANLPEVICDAASLVEYFEDFDSRMRGQGRRRTVVRGVALAHEFQQAEKWGLPTEASVNLSVIGGSPELELFVAARNHHDWPGVPEWDRVYQDWQRPNRARTPLDRIQGLNHGDFQLTSKLLESDAPRLAKIWRPFGWTEAGVQSFIHDYQNSPGAVGWFSGVRERQSGQLVSACKGEQLDLAGVKLIEGTEEGTLDRFGGKGLCTAAVIMLHSQIINSFSERNRPLIFAETNLTSRADIVSRHAGMTAPGVEGISTLRGPRQVLQANVSVLDGGPENSLNSPHLEKLSPTYRFWRNFLFVVLPRKTIENDYSSKSRQEMLAYLENS